MECPRRLRGNVHCAIFGSRQVACCERSAWLSEFGCVPNGSSLCSRCCWVGAIDLDWLLYCLYFCSLRAVLCLNACIVACISSCKKTAKECGLHLWRWTLNNGMCWLESESTKRNPRRIGRALPRWPSACWCCDIVGSYNGGRFKSVPPSRLSLTSRLSLQLVQGHGR